MAVSISEFSKVLGALAEALAAPKTDLNRDASIQRFEFTVELAWKTCKKIMGSSSTAPKEVIREMAQNEYISDVKIWLEAIDKRNLSSHTYKEEIANEVFSFAQKFLASAEALKEVLKNK